MTGEDGAGGTYTHRPRGRAVDQRQGETPRHQHQGDTMQTTARDILKDFYLSDATDDSPIALTDSFSLMGNHPAVPALECGGYALVMGDDTGVNDSEDPDGYTFTTCAYDSMEDRWEPLLDSEYAATADEARKAVAAWFDGLPA